MTHLGLQSSRRVVAPPARLDRRLPAVGTFGALAATLLLPATAASASVFYKFNVVAETPTNGFVSFGTGPSVNDKGKVAFIGRLAASGNESVYLWTPVAGVTNIRFELPSAKQDLRRRRAHQQQRRGPALDPHLRAVEHL